MKRAGNFCAMVQRNLIVHVGGRTDYVQDCLDWVAFKATLARMKIPEKIAKVEAYCSQSRT